MPSLSDVLVGGLLAYLCIFLFGVIRSTAPYLIYASMKHGFPTGAVVVGLGVATMTKSCKSNRLAITTSRLIILYVVDRKAFSINCFIFSTYHTSKIKKRARAQL